MVYLFAILTFFSKFAGGLLALRYQDRLHLILALTSGMLVGVVLLDILPETANLAQELNQPFSQVMIFSALGFLLFHLAEKTILLHGCTEKDCEDRGHHRAGILGASGFTIHSFFDGVAMGLSFSTSFSIGVIIAVAVVAHSFADGLNTTAILLKNKSNKKQLLTFMTANALAPFLGVLSTSAIRVPQLYLIYLLAFFSGFFLYMGASDLLPEAHHKHSSFLTMAMTVLGFIFIFVVTRIISI